MENIGLKVSLFFTKMSHFSTFHTGDSHFLLLQREVERRGRGWKWGEKGTDGDWTATVPEKGNFGVLHMSWSISTCSTCSNMISVCKIIFDHIIFEHNMVNMFNEDVRIWHAVGSRPSGTRRPLSGAAHALTDFGSVLQLKQNSRRKKSNRRRRRRLSKVKQLLKIL